MFNTFKPDRTTIDFDILESNEIKTTFKFICGDKEYKFEIPFGDFEALMNETVDTLTIVALTVAKHQKGKDNDRS